MSDSIAAVKTRISINLVVTLKLFGRRLFLILRKILSQWTQSDTVNKMEELNHSLEIFVRIQALKLLTLILNLTNIWRIHTPVHMICSSRRSKRILNCKQSQSSNLTVSIWVLSPKIKRLMGLLCLSTNKYICFYEENTQKINKI